MPPKKAVTKKTIKKKEEGGAKKVRFEAEETKPEPLPPTDSKDEALVMDPSDEASLHSSDADLSDSEESEESSSSDVDGEEGEKKGQAVLRLRFLPPEFQEPQLYKFLGQFGATVVNCFCVRSRRTHQSKGIAYVQFDKEEVLPLVKEECHGMALGGRAVMASITTLHRPMPSKETVSRRRGLAYAYRTRGAPLRHHDVSYKKPIVLLIKAAQNEKTNNTYLKKMGVDYETDFFTAQLKAAPKELFQKKKDSKKEDDSTEANHKKKTVVEVEKSPVKDKTPVKTSTKAGSTPRKSPAIKRGRSETLDVTPVPPSAPPPTPLSKRKASRSPASAKKK